MLPFLLSSLCALNFTTVLVAARERAVARFRARWHDRRLHCARPPSQVCNAPSLPSFPIPSDKPRASFPPRNTKPQIDTDVLPSLPPAWTCTPSSKLSASILWDLDVRINEPKHTKKDLDHRRAQVRLPTSAFHYHRPAR
jgi:hypothetical protein